MKAEFIGFRATKEMKEIVEKMAVAEQRTLSKMLEILIQEALGARKKAK